MRFFTLCRVKGARRPFGAVGTVETGGCGRRITLEGKTVKVQVWREARHRGGRQAWSTAWGLGPHPLGVRGFESHPPHHCISSDSPVSSHPTLESACFNTPISNSRYRIYNIGEKR